MFAKKTRIFDLAKQTSTAEVCGSSLPSRSATRGPVSFLEIYGLGKRRAADRKDIGPPFLLEKTRTNIRLIQSVVNHTTNIHPSDSSHDRKLHFPFFLE
jgi:hypothetical protein